jgi:hypothetical protein
MAATPKGSEGAPSCVETDEHIKKIKEGLLYPIPETSPCVSGGAGKPSYFDPSKEKAILDGQPPSTGEIPTAIAEEQVQLANYHFKVEEKNNTQILLCGAMDTADAYSAVNNCLALTLLSESTELPKLLADLSKLTADSAKEFPAIAEKIKKAYDQICIVKTAFNAMQQCINKVCSADDKKKFQDIDAEITKISGVVDLLVQQGEEAVMSVVQAASIFALNNVAGFEALVAGIKPQAEQFKKDTDANAEAAVKKTTEWQKKYHEAITAVAVAHSEYGKSGTRKLGKEAAYCFMGQSTVTMKSQKEPLLGIFNPKNKVASTTPPTVNPGDKP